MDLVPRGLERRRLVRVRADVSGLAAERGTGKEGGHGEAVPLSGLRRSEGVLRDVADIDRRVERAGLGADVHAIADDLGFGIRIPLDRDRSRARDASAERE